MFLQFLSFFPMPVCRWIARVPVCPWSALPVCLCTRGVPVCPVARGSARVPGCMGLREVTYLKICWSCQSHILWECNGQPVSYFVLSCTEIAWELPVATLATSASHALYETLRLGGNADTNPALIAFSGTKPLPGTKWLLRDCSMVW